MMLRKVLLGAAVVVGCSFSTDVHAQEVNFGALEASHPNLVQLRVGADRAFIAGVGYGRVFQVAERPLVLAADVTLPIALPGGGDYRARLSVQMPVVGRNRWRLAPRVAPSIRGLRTEFNRMTSLGLDVGFVGGYYAPRWFLSGEFGSEVALSTHVHHSHAYRQTVYADARDGWYAATAANLYYGLVGGYSTPRLDVVARVGQSRNVFDGGAGLLPLYATLGVNIRF